MHKLIFFIFLFISITAHAEDLKLNWQKIPEWKTSEIQSYVNAANITHDTSDNTDIASGLVLFYYGVPSIINVNGRNYTFTSVIRYYVVNCSKPVALRVSDYYFNTKGLPSANDASIAGQKYKEEPIKVSDKNPLYKAFCPKYI